VKRGIWLFAVFLLVDCSPDSHIKKEAEDAVKLLLRDPDSAQFRYQYNDIEVFPDIGVVCGEVNSRNAYGGYAGFENFAYVRGQGAALASDPSDRFIALQARCIDAMRARTHRLEEQNNESRRRDPEAWKAIDNQVNAVAGPPSP
jgi:hypothetical protein